MRIIGGKARGTKLYTLEGIETRPTLDRVKESMFNIVCQEIPNSVVLDLFSGSGAIGLEFVSRGAKKAYLCDNSKSAIDIIKKNIKKTHFEEEVILYNCDFLDALNKVSKEKINIIYIDPPYKTDYVKRALKKIIKMNNIDNEALLIIETDDYERIISDLEEMNESMKIIDQRKYGRANLIFLKKVK